MKKIQITSHAIRKQHVLVLASLVVLAVSLLSVGTSAADPGRDAQLAASTPAMINYQGVVKVDGTPYNGNGYFKFAIVDAGAGNGTLNYWSNDGTASGEPTTSVYLPVNGGLFNVLLGDISLSGMSQSIGGMVFENDPTYLRVWFSQTGSPGTYEALEPNQRIASVGYALHALRADMVDGIHASTSPSANQLVALDSSAYLRVPRVMDSNNTSYYLDPASTSYLNDLRAGPIYAPQYYDRNNTSYYIDPAGSTYLNNTWGSHYAVNFMQSNTGYTVGDSSTNDIDYGLRVRDPDMSGVWISGAGDDGVYVSSSGGDGVYIGASDEFGVKISNSNWSGVHVADTDATGFYANNTGWGVYVESSTYYGVNARGGTAGGYFRDSDSGKYAYIGYGNYGVYSNGTIRGSSFTTTMMHPTETNKVIDYSVLEGGESGTYFRGTAQLQNGMALVSLPEHFSLVTEEEGLTVQVTPRGNCNGLYVAEVTTTSIVVNELQGGTSDISFDYLINGVRVGYADYQVTRDVAESLHMEESSHEQAQMGE